MPKILSLLVVIIALSGCRGPAADTRHPTLTLVTLPGGTTRQVPARAPLALAATRTATPTETPVTSAFTPTVAPAAPAPAAPAGPAAPLPAAPTRLLALGVRATLLLRATPAATDSAGLVVAGSTVLWAEGRSAGGEWLLVTYGKPPQRAWAQRADLSVFGDPAKLPVADAAAAQSPAAGEAGSTLTGRVNSAGLNVRGGPGVDQPVLGSLNAGALITLTARSTDGTWLRIAWPAAEGWVASRFVAVSGDAGLLPATRSATTSVPANGTTGGTGGSGQAGKIAFQTANGGDIYLMNADGSGLRRVASGFDPALSPDGARLAYARWSQDGPGVYVLDLRTGQEQRVAGAAQPRWPVWSPDGTRLVFSRLTGSTDCLRTPLGCRQAADLRSLFGGKDCLETPFGRFCIGDFPRSSQAVTGLTQVTLAGGAQQDLVAQLLAQAPSWRPQSEQIIYRGSKNLESVTPQGELHVFIDDTQVNSPAWSPDGQLMVAQKHLHDHDDIFLYDAAGQMQSRLTQPPFLVDHAPNNVAPAWSPDGRSILFFSDRDGAWRLYRMNADGSGQILFLPGALGSLTFRYDFAAEHMLTWGR